MTKDLSIVPPTRSTNLANTDELEDGKEVMEEENMAEVMYDENMLEFIGEEAMDGEHRGLNKAGKGRKIKCVQMD